MTPTQDIKVMSSSPAFLVLFFALELTSAGKLPDGLKTCSRKDPKLNDCVRNAIQDGVPKFIGGVPSLGIESIDPFRVDRLVVDRKKSDGSPVNIDLVWKNVVVEGIKSSVISNVKADWDNYVVSFDATMPGTTTIKGDYDVDGVILILSIHGSGTFECKLENVKSHVKVHGKSEMINGQEFMLVDRLAFTFDVGHLTILYRNLFNGDEALGEWSDSMNVFLNENWRDILDEIKPSIEASLSSHFQVLAEKVFHAIPITELAPK